MQIQLTGHKVEITPALREFTNNKLERIKRFSDHITSIHVTFDVEKVRQIAEAKINLHGSEIHARSESENMYTAIDMLVDKLMRQLTKHKEKHDGHG